MVGDLGPTVRLFYSAWGIESNRDRPVNLDVGLSAEQIMEHKDEYFTQAKVPQPIPYSGVSHSD